MMDDVIGILVSYMLTSLAIGLCCWLLGHPFNWRIATAGWIMVSLVRRKVE